MVIMMTKYISYLGGTLYLALLLCYLISADHRVLLYNV